MRLLFVTLTPPYPPNSGHRMRDWWLLNALVQEGHSITVLSFTETAVPEEVAASIARVCEEARFLPVDGTVRGWRAYRARAMSVTSALPYGAWRLRSTAMAAAVSTELATGRYSAVMCDDVYMLPNLPRYLPTPMILNKHDITSVIVHRFLALDANPLTRMYGRIEHAKLRRLEARACAAAQLVLACSQTDRELLEGMAPGARVAVVPNVVDVGQYAAAADDDGRRIVFLGAMDWYPNEDAVGFFVHRVFPDVRRMHRDARFVVAGRNPSPSLVRRHETVDGVRFTGTIDDIRPEVRRAAVNVVPLRIGSGTRLKILEASAMAKPTVSTRLGAEGLGFRSGEDIVIEDDPRRSAEQIVRLLFDRRERLRLGRAARRRVEEDYSLPALRASVRATFMGLEWPAARDA